MTLCYLSLGSNLNSPERQLRLALKAIRCLPKTALIGVAPFYFNAAVGKKAQPPFYNTVIALQTTLPPEQLLQLCQQIEKNQGRTRKVRWGARTLDLDLILYGARKINSPCLTIPHPRFKERDFVIVPLEKLMYEMQAKSSVKDLIYF